MYIYIYDFEQEFDSINELTKETKEFELRTTVILRIASIGANVRYRDTSNLPSSFSLFDD